MTPLSFKPRTCSI